MYLYNEQVLLCMQKINKLGTHSIYAPNGILVQNIISSTLGKT